MRRILKTCSWQVLGVVWFMSYALVSGGDLWYTFGLALTSKIISDHNGLISLESKPGNTVFRVSLPFVTKLN